MNPSLKFSPLRLRPAYQMSAKNFLEFSCGLTQFFMWFKGESLRRGGETKWREKLHGETRFMTFNGKSIFVLQWKSFSIFFREYDSGTEGENAMRYTENNPHYYDFLPESTLGHTKEFSLNAFDGEKKMKIRLRSRGLRGLIRKWCWVNLKDRSRSTHVLLINVCESLVKINSNSKNCQSK